MKIENLEPFPPGNPFHHDPVRMGIRVGRNAMVMMYNHEGDHCEHLVVVNTDTGERILIEFEGREHSPVIVS